MADDKVIYVYSDWDARHEPALLGTLHMAVQRGGEVFSFEYATNRLRAGANQLLDADLQFFPGRQAAPAGRPCFGMIIDAGPGLWARGLIEQCQPGGAGSVLSESHYLLAAPDVHRSGALRFKTDPRAPFVHLFDAGIAPLAALGDLLTASLAHERRQAPEGDGVLRHGRLLAAGAACGGSRPKVCVADDKGNTWIAKLPSVHDNRDVAAWAMVAHQAAFFTGMYLPSAMLKSVNGQNVFLSKRFDRAGNGRVHTATAATLMGRNAEGARRAGSYLDIAAFLVRHGARVNKNLEELWRRMVFNIAIGNTDDHLGNHSFIMVRNGWELSPAYDLNPGLPGSGLSLNINETDNALSFDLAMEVAPFFRVREKLAIKIMDKVRSAVKNWRSVAIRYRIAAEEQEAMAGAFRW